MAQSPSTQSSCSYSWSLKEGEDDGRRRATNYKPQHAMRYLAPGKRPAVQRGSVRFSLGPECGPSARCRLSSNQNAQNEEDRRGAVSEPLDLVSRTLPVSP